MKKIISLLLCVSLILTLVNSTYASGSEEKILNYEGKEIRYKTLIDTEDEKVVEVFEGDKKYVSQYDKKTNTVTSLGLGIGGCVYYYKSYCAAQDANYYYNRAE